jgi:hypothetical protein
MGETLAFGVRELAVSAVTDRLIERHERSSASMVPASVQSLDDWFRLRGTSRLSSVSRQDALDTEELDRIYEAVAIDWEYVKPAGASLRNDKGDDRLLAIVQYFNELAQIEDADSDSVEQEDSDVDEGLLDMLAAGLVAYGQKTGTSPKLFEE